MGLVASLSRPGGNVTGVVTLALELLPKLQKVLHELVPTATNLGLLLNPTSTLTKAPEFQMKLQAAAGRLGIQLHFVYASTEQEFEAVFARLSQWRAAGFSRSQGYNLSSTSRPRRHWG
jgi:putative ABC transport system substrate-binding protein